MKKKVCVVVVVVAAAADTVVVVVVVVVGGGGGIVVVVGGNLKTFFNLSKLFLGKQNSDAGREIRVYRVECDSKTVLHIGLQVML